MRYVVSLGLAAALLCLAVVARAAGRGDDDREPSRFSPDVVALSDAGWTIGDLGSEAGFRLVLVAPDRQRALAFELELAEDDGAPVAYRRRPVPVPADVRVYHGADELLGVLRGGPLNLGFECGGLVAANPSGAVAVDELGWYVVRDRAEGEGARRLLARHLARRLAGGAHLVDAVADQGSIAIEVYGHGLGESLHVQLDAAGEIASLEVRETPRVYEKAKLTGERRLGRALGRAGRVERVSVDGLDLTLVVGGKPLRYRFAVAEEAEGCGC